MPIAILLGFLFHKEIVLVSWLVPYLIFAMLLLTFCKIEPRELRFNARMWLLLAIQILGGMALYFAVAPLNVSLAQAMMICMICPVATAAPVVTGMLGGSIGRVAAFSVLSNLGVAVVTPLFFAWISPLPDSNFMKEFTEIAAMVAPLIVLPLMCAFGLRYTAPAIHRKLAKSAGLSFYIWSLSLIIVVGRSVSFALAEPPAYWPVMGLMAIGAAAVCALLFWLGKRVGRAASDSITTGQCLGQKNTVLAIWMAMTYLNGVCSIGPAAYVIWQNTFNSWQIYRHMRSANTKIPEHTAPTNR